MNWSKWIIASLIAGIVYYLLGWLVYGMLLADAMPLAEGMADIVQKKPEEMDMALMIVSCLAWGFLVGYVLVKSGASNWQEGATQGFIIGALMSLSMGAGMVAMYKFPLMSNTWIDMVANGVCTALSAAVAAWFLGRGKQ